MAEQRYRHYVTRRLINKTTCKMLIDWYESEPERITHSEEQNPRHMLGRKSSYRDISWSESVEDGELAALVDRLSDAVDVVNENHWNFELGDWEQPLRLSKYVPGDFHDWHIDHVIGDGTKLAFSIPLNEHTDWDGGLLQLMETEVPAAQLGRGIFFPGYHPHRVTPVTRGVRYVLLGWVSGPRFV